MMHRGERILHKNLLAELELYRELAAMGQSENQHLSTLDVLGLEEVNQRKEELLVLAARLDEERREAIYQLFPEHSQDNGTEPTLREIMDDLSAPAQEVLDPLVEELQATIAELRTWQAENSKLIGTTADYMRSFITELVEKAARRTAAYNRAGGKEAVRESPAGLVDRRV